VLETFQLRKQELQLAGVKQKSVRKTTHRK